MDFKERLDLYKTMIDTALDGYFKDEGVSYGRLLEAMRYSLTNGGKRIRGVLALEFCRVSGGKPETALNAACAIEMLHAYSLIHDDLPCMDDDDTRRGMPSNHIAFGETAAVLAGDALQAEAFSTLLSSPLPDEVIVKCARSLSRAAGAYGMCGGQMLDMLEGPVTEKRLYETHRLKTEALIAASCEIGALAGGAAPEHLTAARDFGVSLGFAFQVRDDMLDELSGAGETGKPQGSDAAAGKATFMSLYGKDACEELIRNLTAAAETSAREFDDPEFLIGLAQYLAERRY